MIYEKRDRKKETKTKSERETMRNRSRKRYKKMCTYQPEELTPIYIHVYILIQREIERYKR